MVFLTSSLRRLIPMFDRVLVKKIDPITKTLCGILLPEKATNSISAKVIEIGPGARNNDGNILPMTVKVGDEVIIPEYGGTKIKLEDQDHFMYRECDLLAI
ncbi:hypothetical protein HZS_827, partial [Henneguya salminicola]